MQPDNHTVIQCNKYPPVGDLKCKEGTNRITAHTDESLITLLLTSSGGLPAFPEHHPGPAAPAAAAGMQAWLQRTHAPLPEACGAPQRLRAC